MIGKKRLALGAGSVTAAGAVATLVAGTTFGLFSATPQSETNNFTSGTVSLSSVDTGKCVVPPNIVPGDSGSCTFKTTYTGNVSAWVGLTTSTTGTLYDGTASDDAGANVLSVTIKDNNNVTYANTGSDLYVGNDGSGASQRTFTVTWSLPSGADNSYQNQSAAVALTVKAVQKDHNGSCTTAGSACSGTSWS